MSTFPPSDRPDLPGLGHAARWQALFSDLEAQLSAADRAEFAAEVETHVRTEASRLRLVDRLRPSVNTELRLAVRGAGEIRGVIRRVGVEWLLIDEGERGETIVAAAALLAVRGAGRWSAIPGSEPVIESRLGLGHALRGVARDRDPIRLWMSDGQQSEGTIDRVGRDFFELANHDRDEFRRSTHVRDVQLVAFAGLALLRRGASAGR